MRLGGSLALVLCLALALAGAAQAAQRYAAPGGAGTACDKAAPCQLTEAMGKAKTGDEVIVGAGTYLLGAPVATPPLAAGVYVHGAFGGPMPKITGSAPSPLLSVPEPGSRIEYLEVENKAKSGAALICLPGGRIERVVAKAVGDGSIGIPQLNDCLIRDSVIRVEGLEAQGIYANSYVPGPTVTPFRNLTVIAGGANSTGIRVTYSDFLTNGSYTIDLKNSIVDAAFADLATLSGLKGPGRVAVTHSNLDLIKSEPGSEIVAGDGIQTTPPLFVDAAGGDYREAPGSPTIDAGAADPLIGATDLLGAPRVVGPAPDIGAYEFVPPAVAPGVLLLSLTVKPKRLFGALHAASKSCLLKYWSPQPRCARIEFALSAASGVSLTVEKVLPGRSVGGKCRKPSRANRSKPRCVRLRMLPGSIQHAGVAGSNSLPFTGWVGGKRLKPGRYRLTGTAGASVRSADFKVSAWPARKR